jgi:hypothetical protein
VNINRQRISHVTEGNIRHTLIRRRPIAFRCLLYFLWAWDFPFFTRLFNIIIACFVSLLRKFCRTSRIIIYSATRTRTCRWLCQKIQASIRGGDKTSKINPFSRPCFSDSFWRLKYCFRINTNLKLWGSGEMQGVSLCRQVGYSRDGRLSAAIFVRTSPNGKKHSNGQLIQLGRLMFTSIPLVLLSLYAEIRFHSRRCNKHSEAPAGMLPSLNAK